MSKIKNMDRRLLTILAIVFVQMLGASMALPILPLYAQREFALPERVIPLLLSVFFAAQFLAGPTIGRLSDKYGRVPVLVVSQIGTAISFGFIAGATNIWILFAARIFDGITGGNIIAAQAYITDITPRERRTEALGFIFGAFGLGFIFGPALGGVLSAAFGPRAPFWMATVAALAVAILSQVTLDETLSAEQRAKNRNRRQESFSLRPLLQNRALVAVLLVAFVGQFAFGLLQATFALWGDAVIFAGYDDRATDLGIGLLFTAVGISQFVTQTVLLGRLIKRFDDVTIVIIGSISRIIGMVFFALITTPWLGPIGALFFAFGVGTTMPPLQSITTETVTEDVRGGILGVYTSVTSLATIFSTALGGVLFAIMPTTQFWVGIVLTALALIPANYLRTQRKKPGAPHGDSAESIAQEPVTASD